MRVQARLQQRKMALVVDSAANVGDTSRRVGHRLYLTLATRVRTASFVQRFPEIASDIDIPSGLPARSPIGCDPLQLAVALVGIGHD